jgi:hypothetical protein
MAAEVRAHLEPSKLFPFWELGELETMAKKIKVAWLDEPQKKDYPAAELLLTLAFDVGTAAKYVKRLRKAPMSAFKARDILRMSAHAPPGLAISDDDRKQILAGKPLSPVLLVRDPNGSRVIIADGFQRVCTVNALDEEAMIPCKIV